MSIIKINGSNLHSKIASNEINFPKQLGSIIIKVQQVIFQNEVPYKKIAVQLSFTNDEVSNKIHRVQCQVHENIAKSDTNYFYQTNKLPNDNITFTVKAIKQGNKSQLGHDETELGSSTVNHIKQFYKQHEKTLHLATSKGDIDIKYSVRFVEQLDIVGGIIMPNLSLAPLPGTSMKYNAIDIYQPLTKQTPSEFKANCFNFYDGEIVPGFDTFQVFPAKFKVKNIRTEDNQKGKLQASH